jgi:hypothetical protein
MGPAECFEICTVCFLGGVLMLGFAKAMLG